MKENNKRLTKYVKRKKGNREKGKLEKLKLYRLSI